MSEAAIETPPEADSAGPRRTHPAAHSGGTIGLALGAIGIVFGDIGTSPLYALQTVFSLDNHAVRPTQSDVYGVISLVFWSVTLIVSIKYVLFIMRADNDGEGGIMALAALARRTIAGNGKLVGLALLLGVIGASLFYGDSVITPAISVLSAVEGLEVASPSAKDYVLPVGIAILTVLFLVQRYGTHRVGRLFGPLMVVWFICIALIGLPEIVRYPNVLKALSPWYVFTFLADHPYISFIALGAVVLSITGAEALYADMGHFGKAPIRRAWFAVVFPALMLNYLGQGALILHDKHAATRPFFFLAPSWSRIPMVVLATIATVIASQAVISGAFSMSRQAVRLGYLPHLTVRHTSTKESGQIYVPAVNWILFAGVLILILTFRSSERLATAYGLAVTGTFLLTSTLFLMVAKTRWHWPRWKLTAVGIVFLGPESLYFAANLTKIVHGGWLPLVIAALVITVMTTWQKGRKLVTARRIDLEGSLDAFVEEMHTAPMTRVPGCAVFPHPTKETTPLALRANADFNHVLHEHVIVVSVQAENMPHVRPDEQLTVDDLGYSDDGIVHLTVRYGFQDEQDIPAAIHAAAGMTSELDIDPDDASYFLSRIAILRSKRPGMASWRKRLFIGLAHNAATPAAYFRLPEERTVVMGSHIEL